MRGKFLKPKVQYQGTDKITTFYNDFRFDNYGDFFNFYSCNAASNRYGSIYLYYGCKEKALQPFSSEVDAMVQHKIISKTFIAFSSENGKSKVRQTTAVSVIHLCLIMDKFYSPM